MSLTAWVSENWLSALGWFGSALLIWSVLQTRLLRLRLLNLAASAVLTAFNAFLSIWSMVAMNLALVLINLWQLRSLLAQQRDESAFEILPVQPDDRYLQHVLSTHSSDIQRFQPDLDPADTANRLAFLLQLGDETVGVVLVRPMGTTAHVELDWVNPRYRDFAPGRFVWRQSKMLLEHGFTKVSTSPAMVAPYYDRIGFTRVGDHFELELTPIS